MLLVMSSQNYAETPSPNQPPTKRKSGAAQSLLITGAVFVGVVVLAWIFTGGSSPTDKCRSLVKDEIATGHATFTEVTYAKDDFVKGYVGAYKSGGEDVVSHWECSTESGDPEITFQSP